MKSSSQQTASACQCWAQDARCSVHMSWPPFKAWRIASGQSGRARSRSARVGNNETTGVMLHIT
eukprot:6777585-Pyramimonas_sp.AAC.1